MASAPVFERKKDELQELDRRKARLFPYFQCARHLRIIPQGYQNSRKIRTKDLLTFLQYIGVNSETVINVGATDFPGRIYVL